MERADCTSKEPCHVEEVQPRTRVRPDGLHPGEHARERRDQARPEAARRQDAGQRLGRGQQRRPPSQGDQERDRRRLGVHLGELPGRLRAGEGRERGRQRRDRPDREQRSQREGPVLGPLRPDEGGHDRHQQPDRRGPPRDQQQLGEPRRPQAEGSLRLADGAQGQVRRPDARPHDLGRTLVRAHRQDRDHGQAGRDRARRRVRVEPRQGRRIVDRPEAGRAAQQVAQEEVRHRRVAGRQEGQRQGDHRPQADVGHR